MSCEGQRNTSNKGKEREWCAVLVDDSISPLANHKRYMMEPRNSIRFKRLLRVPEFCPTSIRKFRGWGAWWFSCSECEQSWGWKSIGFWFQNITSVFLTVLLFPFGLYYIILIYLILIRSALYPLTGCILIICVFQASVSYLGNYIKKAVVTWIMS